MENGKGKGKEKEKANEKGEVIWKDRGKAMKWVDVLMRSPTDVDGAGSETARATAFSR